MSNTISTEDALGTLLEFAESDPALDHAPASADVPAAINRLRTCHRAGQVVMVQEGIAETALAIAGAAHPATDESIDEYDANDIETVIGALTDALDRKRGYL